MTVFQLDDCVRSVDRNGTGRYKLKRTKEKRVKSFKITIA